MNGVCSNCGGSLPSDKATCTACLAAERNEYLEVKNYLRANPNSNAMQVANATGISISKITRYIREGMLTQSNLRK